VIDDLARYGLGALPDPPDKRDYPLSALYASEGHSGARVHDAMERTRTHLAGAPYPSSTVE
jgi:hypothetical protein